MNRLFKNIEQLKLYILTIMRGELKRARSTVVKNITVETSEAEAFVLKPLTEAQILERVSEGEYKIFYNKDTGQFEGWRGTNRSILG